MRWYDGVKKLRQKILSISDGALRFGADKIYLTGYTACPPREDLSKTALGAEKAVPWEHFENPVDAAKSILNQGISLVLLEQTVKSKPIYDMNWSFPLCFIVGNEVRGVSEELSAIGTSCRRLLS